MERSCKLLGYFKTAFIWIATGLGFLLLTRRQPYDWLGFLLLCLMATMAAKRGYLPAAMRAVSTALRFAAVIVWSIAVTLLCLMAGLLLYVMFRPDAGVGTVLVGLVVTLAVAALFIYRTGSYRSRAKRTYQQVGARCPLPPLEPMLFADGESIYRIRKMKGLPSGLPKLPRRFGG
jgi:hypothetical protein